MKSLKLFAVTILDDADFITELMVGSSEKQVEQRVWNEDNYSCLMHVKATEVKEVDGYNIRLINKILLEDASEECPKVNPIKKVSKIDKLFEGFEGAPEGYKTSIDWGAPIGKEIEI